MLTANGLGIPFNLATHWTQMIGAVAQMPAGAASAAAAGAAASAGIPTPGGVDTPLPGSAGTTATSAASPPMADSWYTSTPALIGGGVLLAGGLAFALFRLLR